MIRPAGVQCCAGIVALSFCAVSVAQEDPSLKQIYRMPPKAIADLIDAPPTPSVSVSPDDHWLLIMKRPSLPSISELAEPELRIAGFRINPRTNGRSRRSYYTNLTLRGIHDGTERSIKGLPPEARIRNVEWSADGKAIAFTLTRANGIELWTAAVEDFSARRLTPARLNTAYGSAYEWQNKHALLCRLIPQDRGEAPPEPQVPPGPSVQQNIARKAPARTYQDLLENAHDEALFDHYLSARVARVTLDGKIEEMGSPGIITRAEPSPDGKYLLVEEIHKPYSYIVPVYRFPERISVWNTQGEVVYRVADLPLAEEIPVDFASARIGPRSVGWRADVPATLHWTEAQDEGDPRKQAEIRDRVYVLSAPFNKKPVELVALSLRHGGITWGKDKLALVNEWWWKDRRTRTWIVNPTRPGSAPELLFDRSWEDRYNDPGRPLTEATKWGTRVMITADAGKTLFLSGSGASPEGNRPFLDRLDLKTKETQRLWRSQEPDYEYVVDLLDPSQMQVLTRREAVSEPPNYYLRDLNENSMKSLTEFPHPTPQLKDVHKELIRYEREDGVKLTATLYLPPGKTPDDGPFPMLVWAYPQEFKSADAAGQVTDSPYRFVRLSAHSALLWLVHGYAVLDDPSLPIVGEGDEEPNDSYVEQLVSGARAAIDEVVRRGVADRERIAIGGHSYGAFMTANLLAHSDLFATGIARSGAYNRTLTPFGFQAEERTFWDAPEVYFTMSPFMHAHKINEPLLLIHGEADNNSGTFPIQSERFYGALKGHGATVRLVLLPHESHGYRARESIMHMAWEMTRWLDEYVKNAPTQEREVTTEGAS